MGTLTLINQLSRSMGFADVLAVRVSVCSNFADNLFCHFGVYRAAFGQACVVGVVLILLLQRPHNSSSKLRLYSLTMA